MVHFLQSADLVKYGMTKKRNFIKDHMLTKDEGVTKDDLQQFERRLDIRFDTLESRVGNIESELRDTRQHYLHFAAAPL
jgi:hypothetical protein